MPKSYPTTKIPLPTEGVIRSASMNDTVAPADSVQAATNIVFDRIGAWMTRKGNTLYASALPVVGAILTLGSFGKNSTSTFRLLAQVSNKIYAWDTATWTLVRTMTSLVYKARYSQFLNLTYTVNGSAPDSDPIRTYNGTTYGTTNIAQLPKGDYVQAGYEGRVWVADATLDRLYYSDIVSIDGVITTSLFIIYSGASGNFNIGETITGGTSGATASVVTTQVPPNTKLVASPISGVFVAGETITGADSGVTATITQATCAYIENLSPQDGESITGLHRVPRALLVFKQHHIYRVYSATNIDPYPAYNVGTFSQESIAEAKDGLYFHHSSGFYRFQYDGQPQEISRRIIDYIRAIPRSYYANITAAYDGFDNITWSIGSVTVEGVTYANCQCRYTISTQVWTTYDFVQGISPQSMIYYDDGTNTLQILGTNQGAVLQANSGNDDNGQPIHFELITRWMSLLDIWSKLKQFSGFALNSENGAGTQFQYQTDKDQPDEWTDIGDMTENYTSLFQNENTGNFNRIRFRTKGTTTGNQIIYSGIEIMSIQDMGYENN